MHIVITGSSGFIGREIVRQAQRRGDKVTGIDTSPPPAGYEPDNFVPLDIMEKEQVAAVFAQEPVDAVIHLAATHNLTDITNELIGLSAYRINTEGVSNLLEIFAAHDSIKRVVFTSSQLIGKLGTQAKTLEECDPTTYYGKSKLQGERIVHDYPEKPYNWVIVRPTTVWGPGMADHYVRFINYIRTGKYFHISSRKLYKSWSFVENIAWQYLRLLEVDSPLIHGKSLYLADSDPLSLRDYANEMQKNIGARKIPTFPEMPCRIAGRVGDMLARFVYRKFPLTSFRVNNILSEYVYDLAETDAICGPVPVSFEDGVRKTAEWYSRLHDI